MNIQQDLLIQKAMEAGFSRAVFLDSLTLDCREDLRAFCKPQTCPSHGQNWVCPPGCGTLDACREKAGRFSRGLLLQSVTDLTPPTAPQVYKTLNSQHNFRFRQLIEELSPWPGEVLPLTTGGCVFCDSCAYPEPCRRPQVKMESLSAFGIDVAALCREAGLDYSFREDRVYFTALLMLG